MQSVIEQLFEATTVDVYEVAGSNTRVCSADTHIDTITLDVEQEEANHDLSVLHICGVQTFRRVVDGQEVHLTLTVRSWNQDGTVVVEVYSE